MATPLDVIPEVKKLVDDDAEEALKDILPLTGELLCDSDDLVDSILKEEVDASVQESSAPGRKVKDQELCDILGDHIIDGLPNMDSKDVEDLFKGVLTDESQESADSSSGFMSVNATPSPAAPPSTGLTGKRKRCTHSLMFSNIVCCHKKRNHEILGFETIVE